MEKSKYFLIDYEKEARDSRELGQMIESGGVVYSHTILINCDPYYSSRLVQLINHKLSHLNGNELFEVIDLQMPTPNMSQVWDPNDKTYRVYGPYLSDWIRRNIKSSFSYLFLTSAIEDNSNFVKLKNALKGESIEYSIATPYVQTGSLVTPDFFIEKTQGRILYQWENMDNPNK